MSAVNTIYKFQLVEFIQKGRKKFGLRAIDIIPDSWLFINGNRCFTKFMPPHYTKDAMHQLHNMVKQAEEPPFEWPTYPVLLKGHASEYTQLHIIKSVD